MRIGDCPAVAGPPCNLSLRTRAGQSCETKPIPRRCQHAKQSQFGPWKMSGEDAQPTKSRGAIVRNKANSCTMPIGRSAFPGTRGLVQTKPIPRDRRGRPRAKRAKQTQFGESHTKGKFFLEKELCSVESPNSFGKTKPISGGAGPAGIRGTRGADLYKQSQFPPQADGTSAGPKRAEQSQFLPPCRSGDRRCRVDGRAKQSQFTPQRRGKGLAGVGPKGCRRGDNCAKQTQFSRSRARGKCFSEKGL